MMIKKCSWCGNKFHTNKKIKYCSNYCKENGYEAGRKKARKKYQKKHQTTAIKIKNCKWCNKQFISTHNKKYCSNKCRKYSFLERNLKAVRKYQKKYGRDDKDIYQKYLGTSNLREHRNTDENVELKLIKAELRRLRIGNKMGNL